jgi:parallel beta-helix repeat protein
VTRLASRRQWNLCQLLLSLIGLVAVGAIFSAPSSIAAAPLTASLIAPNNGLTMSFSGIASGGTPPYTFKWDFGDGTTSTTQNANHTYATAGTYMATFTITDAVSISATASQAITVATPFEFSLTNNGNLSVTQGTSATNTATATLVSGTSQPISLSAAGLPAGATASFSPTGCSPTCTSALKITAASSTPAGTYTINVTGVGGAATRTTSFKLMVVTPLSASATATPTSGFSRLAVAFTGSRSGGIAPYSYKWNFGDGTTSTTQNPNHSYANAGNYTATFTISDAVSSTATASQSIAVADFSLTNNGNLSVTQGSSATNTIKANLISGTTQPVAFSAAGLPTGATASFSPTSCSPSCASTLKITAASSTPAGTYTITLTGAGGAASRTTSFKLTVIKLPGTVTLSPGANIQSAINANPPGSTFVLQPGVYRKQSIVPQNGDTFTGQSGAVLNGAQMLTNWVQNGIYWTNTGAPALNNPAGPPDQKCNDPTTGCAYPQDLYINNVPLVHKLALPIISGQWYFDYTNDVVYLADNPAGKTVELGVTQYAFSGSVNNVTVQNLVVEKYATGLNAGAIAPYGSYWLIKNNEVRLNHAAGIKPQLGSDNYEQILSNNVHDNGQEGIAVGRGTGTLIQYNTIANNNYANTFDGNEEGGGKIGNTTNAQVLNNTYLNNNGVGLWADAGATGTIFSGNTISGSRLDGIRHEISHYGTISNNTLTNNAQYMGTGACSWNAKEIVVCESDNTTVSNNTINTNCAGITLTQSIRSPGATFNDAVVHNTITYPGSTVLNYRIGGQDSQLPPATFDPNNHNYFDYNTYHFSSRDLLNLQNWMWGVGNPALTWQGWLTAGQDPNGVAD